MLKFSEFLLFLRFLRSFSIATSSLATGDLGVELEAQQNFDYRDGEHKRDDHYHREARENSREAKTDARGGDLHAEFQNGQQGLVLLLRGSCQHEVVDIELEGISGKEDNGVARCHHRDLDGDLSDKGAEEHKRHGEEEQSGQCHAHLRLIFFILTFVGMAYLSGRIYRVGILMYGKKPGWKEIWKWLKY